MFGFIKAAQQLHFSFLTNVLRLPMAFFEQTPTGRILSRFSKDIDVVDERLPRNFDSITFFTFQVIRDEVFFFLTVTAEINLRQHDNHCNEKERERERKHNYDCFFQTNLSVN